MDKDSVNDDEEKRNESQPSLHQIDIDDEKLLLEKDEVEQNFSSPKLTKESCEKNKVKNEILEYCNDKQTEKQDETIDVEEDSNKEQNHKKDSIHHLEEILLLNKSRQSSKTDLILKQTPDSDSAYPNSKTQEVNQAWKDISKQTEETSMKPLKSSLVPDGEVVPVTVVFTSEIWSWLLRP